MSRRQNRGSLTRHFAEASRSFCHIDVAESKAFQPPSGTDFWVVGSEGNDLITAERMVAPGCRSAIVKDSMFPAQAGMTL